MRRILVLIVWIVGVAWYWQAHVPLAPTKRIPRPADLKFLRRGLANEIVLAHSQRQALASGGHRMIDVGPLEVWSFPAGTKLSEFGSADDEFVSGWGGPSTERLVRHGGKLELINVLTGERRGSIPDMPNMIFWRIMSNGQRLLLEEINRIRAWDLETNREAWRVDGMRLVMLRGNVILANRFVANGPSPQRLLLDATTGDTLEWSSKLEGPLTAVLSNDGNKMLVRKSPTFTMYDVATGAAMWSTAANAPKASVIFSPDSREIQSQQLSVNLEPYIARWDAADGRELTPPLPVSAGGFSRQTTEDGGYAIETIYWNLAGFGAELAGRVNYTFSRLGLTPRIESLRHFVRVVDTKQGRTGGILSSGPQISPPSPYFLLADNRGIVQLQPNEFVYYTLPPRTNWTWLLSTALLPPVGLELLVRALRRLRMRRDPAPEVVEPLA